MVRVNGRAIQDYKNFEVRETGLAVPRAEPLYRPAVSNGYRPDDFIVDDSLLMYLPLHALKGSPFKSVDRYGHSCTVAGALWKPYGRLFDGDDYIYTALPVITADMWNETDDFTAMVWARSVDIVSTGQLLVGLGQNVDDYTYGVLNFRTITYAAASRNRLAFTRRDNTNREDNRWLTDNSTNLSNARWYLAGVTQTSGVIALYIDGAAQGIANDIVGDISGTFENTRTVFGARSRGDPEGYTSFLTGREDEAWIYDRGLAAAEMLHNYNATAWRYQ